MTVAELIAKLSVYPPDMKVVVDGYEGGYDDPKVGLEDIVLDANWTEGKKDKSWSGRHLSVWRDMQKATKVVRVGR